MPRVSPRIGFLGLGWIGRMRLDAVAASGAGAVAAVCDANPDRLRSAQESYPEAAAFDDPEAMLDGAAGDLDALVVATPNAMHCRQGLAALERGLALFVQKPLGIVLSEVEQLLESARKADRLIEVDYTYRNLASAARLRDLIRAGSLGELFLAEGVFHNAYGPDKPWCFDRNLAGGGSFLDLGVHLVDLILWCLGSPEAELQELQAWRRDLAKHPGIDGFTTADFRIDGGPRCHVVTSWHAHTGRDCEIRLVLHGANGTGEIRNVDGSFYDFELAQKTGTEEQVLIADHREWMNRGIVAWAQRLAENPGYDPGAEINRRIARVVDVVYER
jgi:predicted dehydrogenase